MEAVKGRSNTVVRDVHAQQGNTKMSDIIESIKKGPRVASEALLNISRYIKEIHRVDERLKDLMADIISSITTS